MDEISIASLQGLSYSYLEAGNLALDGIDLEVQRGDWVALLGGNGSGKSTLAKHFNALLIPMQGACFICGLDSKEEKNLWGIRKTVSMVFQNPENQIVSTVVEDDTAFGPENLGLPTEEIRARVDRALKIAGLWDKAEVASYTLSGGQKQRLAIAGAIAMDTPCIVLDEPTAMLDPQGRKEVMDLLKSLHDKGTTIIHITHRLEEIESATKVIVLKKGKIQWTGTTEELFLREELEAWGLELPPMISLWRNLVKKGLIDKDVPPEPERLVQALCPSS